MFSQNLIQSGANSLVLKLLYTQRLSYDSDVQTWEKLYSFRDDNFEVRKFPQKCDIYKSIYIYDSIAVNNYKNCENIYLFMEVNNSKHPRRKPVCSQPSLAF